MRTWEQLTELEQLESTYSDMHKEAFGFRPRMGDTPPTVEVMKRAIDQLVPILNERVEEEQAAEAAAVVELEAKIVKLISMGAANREAAIRWIADSEEVNGDLNYLCYLLGVPYGYFSRAA